MALGEVSYPTGQPNGASPNPVNTEDEDRMKTR
jgi:hypothetical protein